MELTKENFDKLIKNLKHWNESDEGRDSHCTANPIFDVQEKVKVYGFDSGYSDAFEFFNSDLQLSVENIESLIEELEDPSELFGKIAAISIKDFFERNYYEQVLAAKELGYEVVHYQEEWKHVNTHLTREAAQAFIKRKQHDHGELRIWVSSLYWCWEFNMIIQGLLSGKISLVEPQTPLEQSDFVAWVKSEDELEYPDGLKICIGGEYLHKNGQSGFLYAFDFDLNSVSVDIGDGFNWEGTGQEFTEQWTKKESQNG